MRGSPQQHHKHFPQVFKHLEVLFPACFPTAVSSQHCGGRYVDLNSIQHRNVESGLKINQESTHLTQSYLDLTFLQPVQSKWASSCQNPLPFPPNFS